MNADDAPAGVALKDSLATDLLRRVFVLYLLVALLLTSGYLVFLYHDMRALIENQLKVYEKTFAPGMELYLWRLESDGMDSLTQGMLHLPYVVGVTISQEYNEAFFSATGVFLDHAQQRVRGSQHTMQAEAGAARLFFHRFKLYHHTAQGRHFLGVATIYSDSALIWEALWLDYILVLGSAALKTAALWVIFLWLSRRYLRAPLHDLAISVSQVDMETLQPVTLTLPSKRRNELSVLQDSFNAMLRKLAAAREALHRLNASLEHTVAARTRELRAAYEQAEAANISKSRFLANISHELRTPMNIILGFTDLLQQRAPKPEQVEFLGIIHSAARNLLELINNILSLIHSEIGGVALDLRPTALPALCAEIAAMFAPKLAAKALRLEIDIPPDLPRELMLDSLRLRQILLNLLNNALKFTEHGTITLAVHHTWRNARQVHLSIDVADTGIGIAPHEQQRIFCAFEQAAGIDQAQGGVGLGLAICRQLAYLMGGDLGLRSAPGEGSCFTLTLGAVDIPEQPALASAEVAPPAVYRFAPARVLVADNIAGHRKLLAAQLSAVGLSCLEARDGEEALRLAQEQLPALVLLDLQMPRLNGVETARRIRSAPQTAAVPLIAISAAQLPEAAAQYFNAALVKPVACRELYACLAEFLAHVRGTASATPAAAPNVEEAREIVPAAVLERLHHFADFGMALELEDWATANAAHYPHFSKRLLALAHRYDRAALLDFIKGAAPL